MPTGNPYDFCKRLKSKDKFGLVELLLAMERPAEALTLLQALTLSWQKPLPTQIYYHTQIGLALKGVGRRGEAAQALIQAVAGIETLRRRVTVERTGFFQAGGLGGHLRSYRALVAVLAESAAQGESLPKPLKKYGPDPQTAAFYFAEATKGRVLLEAMAAGSRRSLSLQLPTELGQKEQQLLDRLGALEAAWEKHYQQGEEALTKFKQQREDLQKQLDELVAQLRQKYPRYAAIHYPQPFKPQELPLKPDEVLLEYALGDKACYLIRVEAGGATKIFKISAGREELEKLVKDFLKPLQNEKIREGFDAKKGHELYNLILAPALADLPPDKRLIIVPDGNLGELPFEALVLKPEEKYPDSVYVGDKWQMSYSQSATILALNRLLQASQAPKPLFALGNPVYKDTDLRYLAFQQGKAAPTVLAQAGPEAAFRAPAAYRALGRTGSGDPKTREAVFDPLP